MFSILKLGKKKRKKACSKAGRRLTIGKNKRSRAVGGRRLASKSCKKK